MTTNLEASSDELTSTQMLESALQLMCQTVSAKAAFIGALENNHFRIIAGYGLSVYHGQILTRAEPWLLPEQMSLIRTHMLPTFATWLNKYLENALGLRVPNTNIAVWLLNAEQPNLETTHQGMRFAVEHLQILLDTTQELRQLRNVQRTLKDKDFGSSIALSIPMALMVMDIQNRIGFINPAFTKLLGYRLQDIHLMNLTDFFLTSHHEEVKQSSFKLEKGESTVQKLQFKQADNTFIWLEINRYPRFDSQQNVIGSIATLREISEEMQTQERIQSIEHDLKNIQSNLQKGSGFIGRLEEIEGAVGLLQMLASNGTDGAITLDDSIIFLERGRIVATQHPRLEGIEAARAITQRRQGQFQFFPGVKTERATLSLDPMVLALEYARQRDEAQNLESSYETSLTLPNSNAAWAFMTGISHPSQFTPTVVGQDVHLISKRMKIIVLTADIQDFKELMPF